MRESNEALPPNWVAHYPPLFSFSSPYCVAPQTAAFYLPALEKQNNQKYNRKEI